jgi:uncharacterized membrane protein (DUF106 family)
MDAINQFIDALLRGYFAAFSWAPPSLALTLLSVAAGAGILWVFSKTSDQAAIKGVKRKLYASLLEMRLFADDPAVTWRAQRSLFAANLRYLALSFRPVLWLALPMALLLVHLESFYGRAPLPAGREAIVTMGMGPSWDPRAPAPQLQAPPEVEIEGPPVRVVDARQVTWRFRPKSECSGSLRFTVEGRQVACAIEARAERRYVPGKSVRSMWQAVWHPANRIRVPQVEWIEVRYPDAKLTVFGVSVNWIVWFFLVSMLAALLLRKRFGVVI